MDSLNKILFLNLPYAERVQRRYMCSYNAPSMLFPPIELMYLASIAREWHSKEVFLIDAIADKLSLGQTLIEIDNMNPDFIVTLAGFEIFESDLNTIEALKKSFPNIPICLFGHYPTEFPEYILEHSSVDFILEGEPDINFSSLLDYLDGTIHLNELHGVYSFNNSVLSFKKGTGRVRKPNTLPFPSHDLINPENYFEPFLPQPFALIQTARGCPYSCNFCVRSYGQKLTVRDPQNIIDEILLLRKIHNIKSFRIIDDTFTATPKRVVDFCELLIHLDLKLTWTCLSRADTLNEKMIASMSKAGCKRVYIGFESGSAKILIELNKGIDLNLALENVCLLKKYNIEVSGFFMVGHPKESQEDFNDSINFAIQANLDYAMAFEYVCYPGTPAFLQYKDDITFSLIPYRNEFIDDSINTIAQQRTKKFYRKFYFRPKYMGLKLLQFLTNPVETFSNFFKILMFQFHDNKKSRNDFI